MGSVLADALAEGRALISDPPPDSHVVQFYEDEGHLGRVVGPFLANGFRAGETLLVIATEEHRRQFCAELEGAGLDTGQAIAAGQLTLLDARETLSRFMQDGKPDAEAFNAHVGGLVQKLRIRSFYAPLRAYGEMVDLLWRDGKAQAALRLEELWNDLGRAQSFKLLCAYAMGNFYKEAHGEAFGEVCAAHSHVLPAPLESSDPQALLREIGRLQQRGRALSTEIEHRKKLEAALREALSARRQAEQQLRRQNEELARTVRDSELFVGILGHDLRNPLSAVITAASLLLRREDVEAAKPAARILNSGRRMARMIDQLLDFTRIRMGKGLPLRRARVNLGDLCQVVTEELQPVDPTARIRLDRAGELAGCWDRDRLTQLLSNLIGNALVHGERAAPVTVDLDGRDGDRVLVRIHNGGAIPEEVLQVIFDSTRPSVRTGRERAHGLGLGLYISQEIVTGHGGQIGVTSSAEEGTCFTVDLPRDPPAAKA